MYVAVVIDACSVWPCVILFDMDLLSLVNESSEGKLVEEVFAELTGESKRRWAFRLVVVLLGASIAVVLVRLYVVRVQRASDTDEAQATGVGLHAERR